MNCKNKTKNKVGIIYDNETNLHKSLKKDYCEGPERLKVILSRLKKTNLLYQCKIISEVGQCSNQILSLCHSKSYIYLINEMFPEDSLKEVFWISSSYFNKYTARIASIAVNAVILSTEKVISGEWDNSFALVRPPGHHAGGNEKNIHGFCVYNNVSIAAKYAIEKLSVKKILIFDWDVHHGNGTQKIFYNNQNVLYVSFHRHDHGKFFPKNSNSNFSFLGFSLIIIKKLN